MSYINTKTDAYPLSAADVHRAHPRTSFPAELGPFEASIIELGYAVVQEVSRPAASYTQNVTEGAPVLVGGYYQQTWVVSNASAEEVSARTAAKASATREERSRRLASSDWTQLSDFPVQPVQEWRSYRQALRALTQQAGFPWDVTWPQPPDDANN